MIPRQHGGRKGGGQSSRGAGPPDGCLRPIVWYVPQSMPKHQKKRPNVPAGETITPAQTSAPRRLIGEPELLAALAVVVCALLTWLARSTLNPDGVSYLDLTNRILAGDWSSFVQGYWSPLYPALVALFAMVAGRDPVALIATAHAINGFAAIATVALLWWWSRQNSQRFFARMMIATFLLISAGLPRIEAVTPDVLLLALMAWIGYELLAHRGERWLLTGLLLGAAFLTKTSAWPWLLLALPLRIWGARQAEARRSVLLSSGVCAAVMLTWIIPMSTDAGHPTLGSAGRLNAAWYLTADDSRTPDAHLGRHTSYHQMPVDSGRTVVWAEFPDAARWTYAPWSDPTAWEAGVQTRNASTPETTALIAYWGRQAKNSLGLWLLPVLLGILLPCYLLQRRETMWRRLFEEDRSIAVVALLGLAGVGQFILVHSEPRLIAPFGLLFALAVLHWLSRERPATPRFPMALRQGATALGLIGAVGFAVPRLQEGIASSARINSVIAAIARTNASLATAGLSQAKIVILGPAIPIEASAFLSGAQIVAQVPPISVEVIKRLPADRQRAVITEIFGGKAQVAWLTTPDAGVNIVVIPPK